jgi:GTPase
VRLGPEESFTLADLPGLIEGAHEGRGLGLRFLQHLERTRVLVFLLDGGREQADLKKDLKVLESELKAYHPGLAKLPRVVAVNKNDLPWAKKHHKALATALRRKGEDCHLVSTATHEGLEALVRVVFNQVGNAGATLLEREARKAPKRKVYRPAARFTLTATPEGFVLEGAEVHKWVALTDFGNDEAVRKLRFIFEKIGVAQALRDAGAQAGDTVIVGKEEFTYAP